MAAISKATRHSRKPHQRFPRRVVRILEQWLIDHSDAPYATQDEQDDLKARTGLKRSQILNWVGNARKRKRIIALRPSPSPSQPLPVPGPLFSQLASLHPFERWLHEGPAHEAASLDAIWQAISKRQEETELHRVASERTSRLPKHHGRSTNWQYFRQAASSISSMEIRSYAANIRSVCSDQWKRQPDGPSAPLTKTLRRHRRPDSCAGSVMGYSTMQDDARRFQCTFCNDSFKKKYDWQRHEKSQHLPLEKWTCCPQGSVNVDPETNEISCVFCGALDPDPAHINGHGYSQCMSRSPVERVFYRKDHLRQHLRLMHSDCAMSPAMETWKSAVTILRSRCGFCDAQLDSWTARVEHLAEHFGNGTRMEEWKGDWGFDTEVFNILERATLPSQRLRPGRHASVPCEQSSEGCSSAAVRNE